MVCRINRNPPKTIPDRDGLLYFATLLLMTVRSGEESDVAMAKRCVNFMDIGANAYLAKKFGDAANIMANDIREINRQVEEENKEQPPENKDGNDNGV